MKPFEQMTEAEALDHLEELTGQRPEPRLQPMLRHAWKCSTCIEITRSPEPIECPAPCARCGGIFFETVVDPCA